MSRYPGIFVIQGLDGDNKETIVDALDDPRPLISIPEITGDAAFNKEIADVKRIRNEENKVRKDNWRRSKEIYDLNIKGQELVPCSSCYDKFLEKETVACPAGHRACINCVVGSIKAALKSARTNSTCIGDEKAQCEEHYSDLILQHILDVVDYQRFSSYQQEQALLAVKDKLLRCPFCGYSESIPEDNEDFKLDELLTFACKNPSCLIISCLKCNQPYHIPVLCPPMKAAKGIESLKQAVQTAVESVLIRHCPTCQFPTFKTEGCNHIKCQNGCHWCYSCERIFTRESIYGHFGKPPTNCQMYEDSPVEDKRRMRQRAQQAVLDWKAKNPDMAHLTIDIEQYMPKK
ncbi:MAG: hypothetical protein EZS28_000278 [Streblomastix strix]|uniref:RING-type domain-containing protein n=1 Tax=Streblomastix strix TaxID=222440 RepID=A0A5J4XCA4_9EUKA|nr:MAG: hypothetical protein EZS28_000278 [Streblomastix strix]